MGFIFRQTQQLHRNEIRLDGLDRRERFQATKSCGSVQPYRWVVAKVLHFDIQNVLQQSYFVVSLYVFCNAHRKIRRSVRCPLPWKN